MKKRLLALALCLVLATSLLPITAAAYTAEEVLGWIDGITPNGTYCGDTYFTISVPEGANLQNVVWDPGSGTVNWLTKGDSGRYKLDAGLGFGGMRFLIDGQEYCIALTIYSQHVWSEWTSNGDGTHSRSCKNGCNTSETKKCADTSPKDCKCDVAGESLHDWQFTRTDSTLTAVCNHSYCPTKEVSATLKADSVTLPESPFNAQVILNGITEEEIKKEFGYEISPIRYKFKAPGDSAFTEITPADGAREGTYQAAVTLSPIEVAARYARNDDGTTQGLVTEPDGSITLYTQYTAVNPETTAQTGDNRPIELMMASIVVFSALAAAAFVADSKRRSRQ